MGQNGLIFLGGGPTAVIDATVYGAINAWNDMTDSTLFGAFDGVLGWLYEDLVDLTSEQSKAQLDLLQQSPAGQLLGSSRYKPPTEAKGERIRRLAEVAQAHDIGYVIVVGGDDTMALGAMAADVGGFNVIGAIKSVDNDLPKDLTYCCPGYGSFAKWVQSIAFGENLDNLAVKTNDPGLVVEWMGRQTGWGAAAAALATPDLFLYPYDVHPQIVIFGNERPKTLEEIESNVREVYNEHGRFVIHIAEGAMHPEKGAYSEGQMIADVTGLEDGFYTNEELVEIGGSGEDSRVDWSGHPQKGGVARKLAEYLQARLGIKVRPGEYHGLAQRSCIHLASQADSDIIAYSVEFNACKAVLDGTTGQATVVTYENSQFTFDRLVPINQLTGHNGLPDNMISEDGFGVTEDYFKYVLPLLKGDIHIDRDYYGNPALPDLRDMQRVSKICAEYSVSEWEKTTQLRGG